MCSNVEGRLSSPEKLQLENAQSPILVTPSGIIMEPDRLLHPSKAQDPISFSLFGRIIFTNDL